MKLTQVMLSRGFGGAERYFTDLSVALAERGHAVQVICHKRFQELERLKAVPGIFTETLSVLGWWDPLAQYSIKQVVKKFSPDLIHAHLARAAYIAGKTARKFNIPLVVKTHNYVNLKYYQDVSFFIATTNDQRHYLLENDVSKDDIEVIPNFSLFPGVECIKAVNRNHIVFASYGRMVSKKGFEILLNAFQELISSGINARLMIGGDGPERKPLQRLCNRLGLDKQVTFQGWLKDVEGFLSDADIFVMPSLLEPFGIAILEAMSCGMPIITTKTKGPMEILDDNQAYFVEAGNVASLVAAMKYVVLNREEATVRAARSLDRYKNHYSGYVVIPRIEQAYRELCDVKS